MNLRPNKNQHKSLIILICYAVFYTHLAHSNSQSVHCLHEQDCRVLESFELKQVNIKRVFPKNSSKIKLDHNHGHDHSSKISIKSLKKLDHYKNVILPNIEVLPEAKQILKWRNRQKLNTYQINLDQHIKRLSKKTKFFQDYNKHFKSFLYSHYWWRFDSLCLVEQKVEIALKSFKLFKPSSFKNTDSCQQHKNLNLDAYDFLDDTLFILSGSSIANAFEYLNLNFKLISKKAHSKPSIKDLMNLSKFIKNNENQKIIYVISSDDDKKILSKVIKNSKMKVKTFDVRNIDSLVKLIQQLKSIRI